MTAQMILELDNNEIDMVSGGELSVFDLTMAGLSVGGLAGPAGAVGGALIGFGVGLAYWGATGGDIDFF